MKKFDSVIKNASDTYRAEIGIRDGVIAAIGEELEGGGLIDAEGQHVIPGGINVRTHFNLGFGGFPSSDDFTTGSKAAGSSVDTALYDPRKKVAITKSPPHENADYTPHEGVNVTGCPPLTLSRGETAARNEKYAGEEARGRYVKRQLPVLL